MNHLPYLIAFGLWTFFVGVALWHLENAFMRIGYPRPVALLVALALLYGLHWLADSVGAIMKEVAMK